MKKRPVRKSKEGRAGRRLCLTLPTESDLNRVRRAAAESQRTMRQYLGVRCPNVSAFGLQAILEKTGKVLAAALRKAKKEALGR